VEMGSRNRKECDPLLIHAQKMVIVGNSCTCKCCTRSLRGDGIVGTGEECDSPGNSCTKEGNTAPVQ
jgi:hypothetical protein